MGTWFSGGPGSTRIMVRLDDLKSIFQSKRFSDSTNQNTRKGAAEETQDESLITAAAPPFRHQAAAPAPTHAPAGSSRRRRAGGGGGQRRRFLTGRQQRRRRRRLPDTPVPHCRYRRTATWSTASPPRMRGAPPAITRFGRQAAVPPAHALSGHGRSLPCCLTLPGHRARPSAGALPATRRSIVRPCYRPQSPRFFLPPAILPPSPGPAHLCAAAGPRAQPGSGPGRH